MIVPLGDASVPPGIREFTVRIPVKVAPTERTALWNAPASNLWTAHLLTGHASAKRAGEGGTVHFPALREPGAQAATPPVTAPTGQNVTLQMVPATARPAGRGRSVINYA